MNRRNFLFLSTYGTISFGLSYVIDKISAIGPLLESDVQSFLSDMECGPLIIQDADEIGQLYLQNHPDENDPEELFRLTFRLRGQDRDESMDVDQATSVLDAQVRRDYEHGRTVLVNGWILARTEARLCALHTLS